MEKRTILALVLSGLVVFGFYLIQYALTPKTDGEAPNTEQTAQGSPVSESSAVPVSPVSGPPETVNEAPPELSAGEEGVSGGASVPAGAGQPREAPEREERLTIETALVRVVFTNAGGDIVSYRLKEHDEKGDPVEMVLPPSLDGVTGESHAFTIAFGGLDARPVQSYFRTARPSPYAVEFSQDFSLGAPGKGETFTLTKSYEFKPDEYMFTLTVSLDSASNLPLSFNNAAYTLSLGPQIGPKFEKLDQRYEYRHYYTFVNGKRRQEKVGEGNPTVVDSRFTWAAVAGKYFAAIVVPDTTLYQLAFSARPEPGLPAVSRLSMIRPGLTAPRAKDLYHFYLGPKNQESLGIYDTGVNSYKLKDLQFSKVASTSGILSPLENLLKWLLQIFYGFVPNYGVAIILLTLLVKLVLFPLTKKSSEMSVKMQAIAPKIKELQEKYRDNPAKLNQEMGLLYKKEGHNPMMGCLPLLIQMPILFAMYNLFNTHFDLRGAMFLPGWIPDLSLPESILDFGFTVPLLGWNSLRLLPFIYLGSQLLYGAATRTPDQEGNPSMKMMLYAMPIVFFFILYNVPSGLVVFWIMSNVFTLVQQIILNKYLAQKRAKAPVEEPKTVIAPPRRRKGR
ncbi:MAG: membrane protein insertase YidC [Treponema sp.]|jgi:YidC/Oxa1 family membrane protein insertase|nr:membrane protein insertase YidC [Treponema sp.]